MRSEIERVFEGKAFMRPLFYSYPGGLRFELSEGGSAIERFLLALRKAATICADIFPANRPMVVCLRAIAKPNHFAHRELLSELRGAGISFPRARCLWLEAASPDDDFDYEDNVSWLHVAFEAPASLLQNFLWCAFATDFGSIRPHPRCNIYLFNLNSRVMVWPYDDRGMDVVGPNHMLLSHLYVKHHQNLLDHDRQTIAATFEPSNPSPNTNMPATNSWNGDSDPNFDQDFADGFIGKYVLIGITHLTHEGEFEHQEQLHGRIQEASPSGIEIALAGVNEGKNWRMPPMFEDFDAAGSGVYELRSTGEVVDNPDFTLRITIRSARKN